MTIPADFRLSSYHYDLPEDRIAQEPADRRDGSKLLILDRSDSSFTPTRFDNLLDHLPENALMVANNSRVVPARVFGRKPSGGKVEFLLLTPLPLLEPVIDGEWFVARAEGLLRASKSPKPDAVIHVSEDLKINPVEASEFGRWKVELRWRGDIVKLFGSLGHLPLPPYIKREDDEVDKERYQTVYADDSKAGSVAAPTAGLHFTPELRKQLLDSGRDWAEVTLYVGYGTFSPVRADDIREHAMHAEYIEVPPETAEAVRTAKRDGRPVVAVGTTSARTLEGMHLACGDIRPYAGETDIFIYPGHQFNVVDAMLTNFHLPQSSLVMMIAALVGRETILSAYQFALEHDFRFFSYGDSMLIK